MRWLAAIALAACGTPPLTVDAGDPLCFDAQGALAPTFTNVQHVFDAQCTTSICHGQFQVSLIAPAYARIVNQPAVDNPPTLDGCGGTLVTPGDPGKSYLYTKLSSDAPCAGTRMPRTEFAAGVLADCQRELIRGWIAAGAQND
jgi:hypothetical protein